MSAPTEEQFGTARVSHKLIQGQRILVKTASGRGRARLRHEAEVLALLKLPGLVEMIEIKEEDDQTILLLVDNGPRTLLRPIDMTGDDLLRTLQRCCDATEDLHSAGWSHGALRADHVLLGARGRPKLCSLADSQPLNHLSAADSATAIQADVSQLAVLCGHVAALQVSFGSRKGRWLWRQQSKRLSELAVAGASGTGPTTMRELRKTLGAIRQSRSLAMRMPIAKGTQPAAQETAAQSSPQHPSPLHQSPQHPSPQQSSPQHSRTDRSPTRGVVTLGVAAVGVALLICLGFAVTASSAPSTPRKSTASSTLTRPPAGTSPRSPLPSSAETVCDLWPVRALGNRFDIDGDSCPDQVSVQDQFITVGELTYQVGVSGDRLAVGDWDCDGLSTALLLRPSTGELYEFSSWATPGTSAQSSLVSTIFQAVDVYGERLTTQLTPKKQSCDKAVVALLDGSQVDPPL